MGECSRGRSQDDPKWMYFAMEFDMPNDDLRRTIPLFLHGDKVNYESDDSTMVWHVGSLLSQGQSLISGHMLASIPAKATVSGKDNDTWLPICKKKLCLDSGGACKVDVLMAA